MYDGLGIQGAGGLTAGELPLPPPSTSSPRHALVASLRGARPTGIRGPCSRLLFGLVGTADPTRALAGIATLLSVTPFVLFRYGSALRARSPFARELARREGAGRVKQGGERGTEGANEKKHAEGDV